MGTTLTDKVVKTRKSHQCFGCGKIYEKGSKMRYNTYAFEGTVDSSYWCETCDYIISNYYDYWDLQDGIQFASVWENDIGFWESTKVWKIDRAVDENEITA